MSPDVSDTGSRTGFSIETVLLASVLFVLFVVIVPLLLGLLPVELSSPAWWVCVALAIAATSFCAASVRPSVQRRRAALWAMLVLAVAYVMVSGTFRAFDSWFSRSTVDLRTTSPTGGLVATVEDTDQGALGDSIWVIVRGRLVPGVLSWSYLVPVPGDGEYYPERLAWLDDRTLEVDGRDYRMPGYIVAWSR